jgi:hypothetical protein
MPNDRIEGFRFGLAVLVLAMASVFSAGCSSFKTSRGIDVAPFAQNTVGMIGEVQRVSKPVVWVQLKPYESLPSVQAVREANLPTRALMRGVALYSTQIVSIYGSPISESRKVAELAAYLHDTVRPTLVSVDTAGQFISQSEYDAAVRDMRSAKTFLAALSAAQPIVSGALAFGNAKYDVVSQRIDAAADDISRRVEAEFGPLKEQMATLQAVHFKRVEAYALLSRYRLGEAAALDSLRASDPELTEVLPPGKRPSSAALDGAEEVLLKRMATIQSLREQLETDFSNYRAQQLELDELRTQANESVRLGRITLILWSRSHQNLAQGIKIPAAIDVMGMVKGAATKAGALP